MSVDIAIDTRATAGTKQCARLFAAVLSCILFCAIGWAQNYPAKVVRYVVPDSAGGSADVLARIVAAGLTEVFGRQFIVDNRTGAGSTIGSAIVAKSPADGYTMLQISQSTTVSATLYRNLSYDLIRDFVPVTEIGSFPAIVVAHPSVPVKSIAELIKLAKARPGALNYASAGTGTATFIATEYFKMAAGMDMVHVPYRGGGEAIAAILSGEASVYFLPLSNGLPYVQSGKVRPLAATSVKRLSFLPDLPTVAESGYPGFAVEFWFGLMLPAKTPKEIVTAVHDGITAVLNRPDAKKRMQDAMITPIGNRPEEFGEFVKSEIEKWAKVIRATGLTAN
jgi:tripartite-type tricarboxylate transporter receptor subunit TctC